MGKPTIYIYLYPSPLPNTELFNSPKNITHFIIWSSGWIIYSENKGKGLSHLPYKAWCWWTEKIFVELSKNAEMNCFLGSPLRWRCWEVFRYNNALVVCLLDDWLQGEEEEEVSSCCIESDNGAWHHQQLHQAQLAEQVLPESGNDCSTSDKNVYSKKKCHAMEE